MTGKEFAAYMAYAEYTHQQAASKCYCSIRTIGRLVTYEKVPDKYVTMMGWDKWNHNTKAKVSE